ncbi:MULTISPECIES: AAA family ATPase [unclassified Dehalobacter]|uniref:ATP-binding protein n=1 Tax=unclassified Dehalobacter TaxID=2635733 RepID=UPI000E6CEC45|nr:MULTISPECIES: AAA family ATPase [unclassified Dehalobacter]RJE47832.1 carbon monoxide dehydrogenase [Dehalobacter sp. MCB1]TCX49016.1 carbon monoxide dehydrogenase [Dehalobacter sp. 14DCB1]TCX56662.1 carbon monoxide dehydrogenase [Dehalobacter sp. 12DCB1]
MGKTIAVAGKGGTGKTTITGLLIDYLVKNGQGPVLGVDADANANLNEVLGEAIEVTLGEIREEVNLRETMRDGFPGGMTKAQYLQYQLNTSITEGNGYDLLVMGRSEGKGCYCFVNGILREQLDKVSDKYRYVVIDNEAGMEHLSRGTARYIDILILVSDCSRRGVQAVGRINKLVRELGLKVAEQYLIINKAPDGKLNEKITEEIPLQGLELLGIIALDPLVYAYDSQGKALVNLPDDSISKRAIKDICQIIGL